MNRHPSAFRYAAPSEALGAAPRGGPDESLVVDARAGLTPADMVERALQYRLRGGVASASHVQMGLAHGRGRAAEAPPAASPAPPAALPPGAAHASRQGG